MRGRCEGVEARVPADLWYVGDDVRALTERAVSTLMWEVAGLWSDAGQPASLRDTAAALNSMPVLVIAADAPGERAVAADLASISPQVEVWQTTGIGHVQSLALAPVEWESRVIGFLDRSL